MKFKCQSLAHWKICEWLAEHNETPVIPAKIEVVNLNTLTVTGSLGQTLTLKWSKAAEFPGSLRIRRAPPDVSRVRRGIAQTQ